MNAPTTAAPTTAATEAATFVLEALATAFGGWSQFPDEIVGDAIFGQFNNGGPARRGGTADEVMDAAASILAERWQDDLATTRAAIAAGFDAARAHLEGA